MEPQWHFKGSSGSLEEFHRVSWKIKRISGVPGDLRSIQGISMAFQRVSRGYMGSSGLHGISG